MNPESIVTRLLEAVGSVHTDPLGATLALFFILCGVYALELNSPLGRQRIAWLMEADAVRGAYRERVGGLLDRIDRGLTPQTVADHPDPGGSLWNRLDWLTTPRAPDAEAAARVGRDPFGWSQFDLMLRLAVAYPVLFLLGQWLLGGEGRLGEVVLLPREADWWARPAASCGLVLLVASLHPWLSSPSQLAIRLAGLGLFVAFAVAGAFAVAVAGVFAVAVAVAGAFAVAVAGAGAFAVAGAVAAIPAAAARRGRGMAAYGALCAVLLALLFLGAAFGATGDNRVRALLLFLGLLPLANAVFDHASIGLTRRLIREGARAGGATAFLLGLADLVAALVAFTLLGCTLIALVHLMNGLAAVPLLDLGRLFADLRDPVARWDYVWLWAMVFSTVLPTLAHASLACLGLVAIVPQRHRDRVTDWLSDPERDWWMGTKVVAGSAALVTAALVAPLAALVWGVWTFAPGLGDWYLWLFEQVAHGIGAAVPDRPAPRILPEAIEV